MVEIISPDYLDQAISDRFKTKVDENVWIVQLPNKGPLANQRIAIKLLEWEDNFQSWMIREIDILIRVNNHPNIVQLIGTAHLPECVQLCFQAADGNLLELIQTNPTQARLMFSPVLLKEMLFALASLETLGIYHFDIKPTNILFHRIPNNQGSKDQSYSFKLADFGLSELDLPGALHTGEYITKIYRPPEMWLRQTNYDYHRSDVWALAMTVIEAVIGHYVIGVNNKKGCLDQIVTLYKMGLTEDSLNPEIKQQLNVKSIIKPRLYMDDWNSFKTTPCRKVLSNMLILNPSERWSAQELIHKYYSEAEPIVLNHPLTNQPELARTKISADQLKLILYLTEGLLSSGIRLLALEMLTRTNQRPHYVELMVVGLAIRYYGLSLERDYLIKRYFKLVSVKSPWTVNHNHELMLGQQKVLASLGFVVYHPDLTPLLKQLDQIDWSHRRLLKIINKPVSEWINYLVPK